ncbi:MAG: S9 family peptidase [Bacteroidetes bacterium]|nr:S9 family peptidase [Bacteroidota bacterium]
MTKKLLMLAFALVVSHSLSAQVKTYELRDFFKNAEKTRFQISPEGNLLSYLAPWNNRMNIHIQKIGEKSAIRITSLTDRDISGYFWKNNNSLIYVRDFGGDENFHLFVASTDGKTEKDLTPFKDVRVSIIDDLEDFPNEVLIQMNKDNPEVFDVYRLNITTGDMKQVAKNPGNISGWVTDHTGAIRAAVTTDGVESSLLVREKESDEFKVLMTTDFRESVSPLFYTFDNKQLYAASNVGRDKQAIVRINTSTGKEEELLFEHPEVDVSELSFSRKRKVLTSIGFETDKYEYKFLDVETETMYTKFQEELKGYHIAVTSKNKNEDKFLVRTYSDRSLGAYYMYDKATDKLTKLHEVSPWINEDDMCEMRPVSYEARDGKIIHGYLTIPKTVKDQTKLPVVINPHGGPWARDSWGYNPEVQFLANRGYAVFQMNFRGSTGYGRKFWESSFKQWGQAMQNDISDGVKWLVANGIADPKRVAIYGASYGGYATLAGITTTPDLYACAVDYVGVSNLFTFMKTIPPYWKPYLEMMYTMVGNPQNPEDSVMMHQYSPVFHVDKIKCPLFIAQGAKDPRVNKDESDQVVEALKKNNIEVQYLVKDNEGHGFRNEENKFEFYGAMETFLGKHLAKKSDEPLFKSTPYGK